MPDIISNTKNSAVPNRQDTRINIATSLNSRYVKYTCVMLTSLFVNQPDSDISIDA
ncbi:hypothetical protein IMSAGC019_02211 [Lachnospiraceae bacterium]|nr:hypothetical protein IMSAGC019_02211 [Lachnospiraceae bacterium]